MGSLPNLRSKNLPLSAHNFDETPRGIYDCKFPVMIALESLWNHGVDLINRGEKLNGYHRSYSEDTLPHPHG